jgi:hypothetical protein
LYEANAETKLATKLNRPGFEFTQSRHAYVRNMRCYAYQFDDLPIAKHWAKAMPVYIGYKPAIG